MLRCYGGDKASDLTGAKTMTHYVCLWCTNAVTFTETVSKTAKVFSATGSVTSVRDVLKLYRLSVIKNGKEKKTLSWITMFQEMRLRRTGSIEGSSPLKYLQLLQRQSWFSLPEWRSAYAIIAAVHAAIIESFDFLSLWKHDSWSTGWLQDGMKIVHYKMTHS